MKVAETVKVPIHSVRPNDYNPNMMSEHVREFLNKNLDAKGQTVNITVRPDPVKEGGYIIIDGEHRWREMIALGAEEIAVVIEQIDEAQAIADTLNYNATRGEPDADKLGAALCRLEELRGREQMEAMLVLEKKEIDRAMKALQNPVVEDDTKPKQPEVCRVALGDLWKCGEHLILCGDATNSADWEKLMGGKKAAITFTSPPYNMGGTIGIENQKGKPTKYAHQEDQTDSWVDLLQDSITHAVSHSEYAFFNLMLTAHNKFDIITILDTLSIWFVDVHIWAKDTSYPNIGEYVCNSDFEFIFIFRDEPEPGRAIKSGPYFRGNISNVFHGPRQHDHEFTAEHSAAFPIELPVHFISNFTYPDAIVADCFGGIGTTLIACEKLKRKARIIEIVPEYVEIMLKRWEDATQMTAERLS